MDWHSVLDWLQGPLFQDLPIARWGFIAAAAALFFLILGLLLGSAARRRQRRAAQASAAVAGGRQSAAGTTAANTVHTQQPPQSSDAQASSTSKRNPLASPSCAGAAGPPPPHIRNIQGLGRRDEQQDAFGLSSLDAYSRQGVLALLCDGMGGLSSGREIAQSLVNSILADFPYADFAAAMQRQAGAERSRSWERRLAAYSRSLLEQYKESGGSTLTMLYSWADQLYFWSVGDSDLFLLRDHHLYPVNNRHEYVNDLFLRALDEGRHPMEALQDPQKNSLSHYMGGPSFACDFNLEPIRVHEHDRWLLCSDGISDSLHLGEIQQCLAAPLDEIGPRIEGLIEGKALDKQDNYTGIVLSFEHGSLH